MGLEKQQEEMQEQLEEELRRVRLPRDKVRKESGSVGLSMVGRNEFAPISEEVKVTRTELNDILPKEKITENQKFDLRKKFQDSEVLSEFGINKG